MAIVEEKEAILQHTAVTVKDLEAVKEKIPTWREIFLHADRSAKRVLVNRLIERIDITRELVTIHFRISLEEFLHKSRMS